MKHSTDEIEEFIEANPQLPIAQSMLQDLLEECIRLTNELAIAQHHKLEYYRKNIYGKIHYCFTNPAEESIFQQLTGRKTLNINDKGLLQDLSSGKITFEETLAP